VPTRLSPRAVAERLDAELTAGDLTHGQRVFHELPEGFWSIAARLTACGLVDHLVSLSWGLPPAAELNGIAWALVPNDAAAPELRWYGRTDSRGQFWVRGLPEKTTCRVRYVPWPRSVFDVRLLEAIGDRAARQVLLQAAQEADDAELRDAARAAADRLQPRTMPAAALASLPSRANQAAIHAPFRWDGRSAYLWTDEGRVLLHIQVAATLSTAPLTRFRLVDDDEETIVEGLVPMLREAALSGETKIVSYQGATVLELLAEGWRDRAYPVNLCLHAQSKESLTWRDYELAAQSHLASRQPYRAALEDALHWMRHVYQEWLLASAYGVPAVHTITAMLPTDDEALRELLTDALRGSIAQLGLDISDDQLMKQAKETLVGRAKLSPADQLRMYRIGDQQLIAIVLDMAVKPGTGKGQVALPDASTVQTGSRSLEARRGRIKKLEQLAQRSNDDRLNVDLLRLTELAGPNLDDDLLAQLGLSREEVSVGRDYVLSEPDSE